MKNYFVGAVAALAFAATAGAQDTTTKTVTEQSAPAAGGVTFTVGGGASFPTGKSNDVLNTGWNAMAGVGFNLPWVPFALRAEGAYNRFKVDEDVAADSKVEAITAGLNGIVQAPLHMAGAAPYLTAGLGYGHVKATAGSVDDTENKLMWNAGVGLKFSMTRFDTFVEGRYTQVMTDVDHLNYFPVFVGFTLRP